MVTREQVGGQRMRPVVLFLCQHNAGRSQLGAALMHHRFGDRIDVRSAGIAPSAAINSAGAASLAELGIDSSHRVPRAVTEADLREADVVVAMKPGLQLPVEPTGRLVIWELPDPGDWDVNSIRPLRDAIDARVQRLAADIEAGHTLS
jgi:arsenate reductase (thioredoxin)